MNPPIMVCVLHCPAAAAAGEAKVDHQHDNQCPSRPPQSPDGLPRCRDQSDEPASNWVGCRAYRPGMATQAPGLCADRGPADVMPARYSLLVLLGAAAGLRQGLRRRASRPVGRVLCTRVRRGPAAIHLGLPLLTASCGLPASIGRAALKRSRSPLAPPKRRQGPFLTLLQVGFTKPPQSPAALVVSYTTVSPLPGRQAQARHPGGLFSVALSRGSPRVGVTDHHALRSPDLPHRDQKSRRGRPAGSPAVSSA